MSRTQALQPISRQRRSVLGPLDTTLVYLRQHWLQLAPLYLLAATPLALAMLVMTDVVSAKHRAALPMACWLLTGAMIWRWAWLGLLQKRVQEDQRGQAVLAFRKRVLAIVLVRLICFPLITWGSVLIVPSFYAWFASTFAAPTLLETPGPTTKLIGRTIRWTHAAIGRLWRLLLAMVFLVMLMCMVVMVTQHLLVTVFVPRLLGVDTLSVQLTLTGTAAMIMLMFALFMLMDFFWAVASVILFYDLQARRLGSDLRQRLSVMIRENAS